MMITDKSEVINKDNILNTLNKFVPMLIQQLNK